MAAAGQLKQSSSPESSEHVYRRRTHVSGWGSAQAKQSSKLKRLRSQSRKIPSSHGRRIDPIMLALGGTIVVGVFSIVFVASNHWNRIVGSSDQKVTTVYSAENTRARMAYPATASAYNDPNIKDTWTSYTGR